MENRDERITRRIRVYGIVQGVGFRPTVSRHAVRNGVAGSVCNKGPYVEILAQGTPAQVQGFLEDLEKRPPKRAAILKLNVVPVDGAGVFQSFEIIESEKVKGEIFVSPDIAICEDCKAEMFDPSNRRYLHPFINCTCCGPRLTILDALPYDRERTSMKDFPMCPSCSAEYHDPKTRRFDAQPVCCNDCGPQVYLIGREERGSAAITHTRQVICSGGIAAIKGIGGFHLCCDASNETAVRRLRQLKRRPAKPFAVMARDMAVVRRECRVNGEQESVLDGHQKPILLLERQAGGRICPSVAPDNPKVGVMLPYAPVQLLLFDNHDGIRMPDCLVMTSGNTSGAPICRDDADAVAELSGLCDCILSHNRKIRIRADDSVMDTYGGRPYMIRRSRGYAPLPVMMSGDWHGQVLAVGGELKNTFCIGVDGRFYLSPYVGDLEDLRTVKALRETIGRLQTLLEAEPETVACDLHPRYNSTLAAEELGLPVVKLQHHYAHILSCMAENDCTGPVIGVSFDGTGYGTDGTIWGGEILLADERDFTRFASIEPFLQIGGDVSAREGWRIAAAILYAQAGRLCERAREVAGRAGEPAGCAEVSVSCAREPEGCAEVPVSCEAEPVQEAAGRAGEPADSRMLTAEWIRRLSLCDEAAGRVQMTMADRRINAVDSTSAGRLFDAVSAILGIRRSSTFEGEASTALEFAAEAYEKSTDPQVLNQLRELWLDRLRRPFAENETALTELADAERTGLSDKSDGRRILPTGRLAAAIAEARMAGEDAGKLAYVFHVMLAEQIRVICESARQEKGLNRVALSGGVFQNQLLLRLVDEGLQADDFQVLRHSLVPPNDGGLALGQAYYAMALQNRR